MKKIVSILLMIVLMLSLSVTAFADSSVVYEGGAEKFVFAPGSKHSSSDLFENFKNMMPGDTRTQKVQVRNNMYRYYVKLYLKAIPHNAGNMPIGTDADLDKMLDFLDCFTLTIYNGSTCLYTGSANIGGPSDWAYLGQFHHGHGTTLTVELHADIEKLNNDYADMAGEVDWVFRAEEIPEENPVTGDSSNIWLYATLCGLSAVAVVTVVVVGRKRKNEN